MLPHPTFLPRNRRVRPIRLRAVAVLILGWSFAGLAAEPFPEWAHRQTFRIEAAGLVKISLPANTLDQARADLADVRLTDSQGSEIAYLIEFPRPPRETRHGARNFQVTLGTETTTVTLETGTGDPLAGVTLQTPATTFIKAVEVQGSDNLSHWQLLGAGLPLFRQGQGREEQLFLPLPRGSWPFLRMTIDDRASAPVPFTGAQLHVTPALSIPTEPVTVTQVARDETRGESKLTLDLGAARLPLAEIVVESPEPFFRRSVRLMARQLEGITIQEKELARGLIHRAAAGAQPGGNRLELPLDLRTPSRELLLVIENGDSPPLKVDAVRARRWPVHLLFWAIDHGEYRLYTGNPVCRSPEYDLSIPEPDLRQTPLTAAEFLPPTPNPGHQSTAIWPEIDPFAGRLEMTDWTCRRPVGIETAGVQRLELDLEVLAHAQSGQADLRLMIGDRQVPYILERRPALQSLKPVVRPANDPDRPRHSRWSIELPFPNLPVRLLMCASTTAVFQREMLLFEEPTDQRGWRYRRELGRATWIQAPDRGTPGLFMNLSSTPITDRLTLETDNEDNPPLQLTWVELGYPPVQLLFKSDPGTPLFLYYGNPRVGAPQYDLSLVAEQIVAADKVPAFLGRSERLRTGFWGENQLKGNGGIVFWGVLVLVVAGLLVVITRLVPKPSTPPR